MNKKGFTLIELLAVIIILGILMIIAIPSVTRYISDSRKEAYVTTIKEYISAARNMINSGKFPTYDSSTTYYVPLKCLTMENGGDSPYGKFEKAYVLVTYDGKGYNYYFGGYDESGIGINITKENDISSDKIKTDMFEFNDTASVEQKYTITKMDEDTCKFNTSTVSTNPYGEVEIDTDSLIEKYTITPTYNIVKNNIDNYRLYYKPTPTSNFTFASNLRDHVGNGTYFAISFEYNDINGIRQAVYYVSKPTIIDKSTNQEAKIKKLYHNYSETYKDKDGDIRFEYYCSMKPNDGQSIFKMDCVPTQSVSFGFCNYEDRDCFVPSIGKLLIELENGDVIDYYDFIYKANIRQMGGTSYYEMNYNNMTTNALLTSYTNNRN